ncbi:ROK family protein [Stratiformator vulcanicus]|uniref:Glucokinase n=1 Tax=Stratiformator vulcanicus TaxID=2527980 RepID=A0A517QZT3_9PLAN|nr:ROK family protein [Stratiformator vulcanicus]QDT37128.1 Glucokinase [Stratiformator vulcanicus]
MKDSGSADTTSGPYFLGIDVGGTNIKCGVVSGEGTPLSKTSVKTETEAGPDVGLANLEQGARQAVEQAKLSIDDIVAVGLVTPGPMDIPEGRLLTPANMPEWHDLPVRDLVSERLGKPTAFQNDANAAAYGEFWAGQAKDVDSLVYWTLGTGIGCGIIVNDMIIQGAHSHGSECGHIIVDMDGDRQHPGTGQRGTLEAYAAARALVTRCREALAAGRASSIRSAIKVGAELTPKLIADHAERGDRLCDQLVMDTAMYLGVGTVTLMHTIDPEMILFGGAMTFGRNDAPLGQRFLHKIKGVVQERAFPTCAEKTEIDYATLGGDAGFIGAAGCAKQAHGGTSLS